MISVIGIGVAGSNVVEKFRPIKNYKVYQLNNKVERNTKYKYKLKHYDRPEDYEEHIPNLKTFFKEVSGRVQLFIVGSSMSSNYALGVLEQLKDKEKAIQKAEKKIIEQKKLLAAEEYKKKVTDLRNQVASLQKERNNLLESVAKQRTKAKSELLKNLNPIIQDYMKEKKIRMVIDKKGILLADENLDLTEEIIELLNKKLKSIKLK